MPDPVVDDKGVAAGAPPADGNPAAAEAWTTGLDAELLGHAQNLGWHDKTPAEAAREALKAHRSAQLMLGVPADRIVKLPAANADPKEWDAVWTKLGKPTAPTDYDFSTVKVGEEALPQAKADFARQLANDLNLSKEGAVKLAAALVKSDIDAGASGAAEKTAALEAERAALAKNWGQNKDTNLVIAKNTALKLGVTPESVSALENVVGYAAVMEMFRSIGTKIGEDSFVGGGGDKPGVMTRDMAVARKGELMKDAAWAARYMDGGVAEQREMKSLLTLIHGDDTAASNGF